MPHELADYLTLSATEAEAQWHAILARRRPSPDGRQEPYRPVETLLCAAAMLIIDQRSYGGSAAAHAAPPVPELAALFRRPTTSIPNKMANLDGSRPKGGKSDMVLWQRLSADHEQLFALYRTVLAAARAAGVDRNVLPDFLGLEHSEHFELLGQDELDGSVLEGLLRETFEQFVGTPDERPSERETIQRARIGQHRFARGVLSNCGWQCVFCGFSLGVAPARPLLRASHIKPWRASSDRERRDVLNGVAACPTHDAAFDAGDLALDPDLSVCVSSRLRATNNGAVRASFSAPLLRTRIDLPDGHTLPRTDYIQWHRGAVFRG